METLLRVWAFSSVKLVCAVALLVGITAFFHWVLWGRAGGKKRFERGLWPLIIGMDGRVSTSKLQVFVWSYAVVFGLLLLLFHGKEFSTFEWQPEYLLLLGSPAAAALLAKAVTSTKTANGTVPKPEEETPRARDVVSDDEGRTDLFDFQYLLISFVVLVYFFVQLYRTIHVPELFADSTVFLPPLPLALVALTSLSAASYVAKKGLEDKTPVLTGVYPAKAAPRDKVTLLGKNLAIRARPEAQEDPQGQPAGVEGTPATRETARVTFDGVLGRVENGPVGNEGELNRVEVRVPADVGLGSAPVQYTREDGAVTEALGFEVVAGGPSVSSVRPRRVVPGDEAVEVTIAGSGFGEEDEASPPVSGVILDERPLEIGEGGWSSERVRAQIPPLEEAREKGFAVPGSFELVVQDRHGRRSAPETVWLDEVVPTVRDVRPGRLVLDDEAKEITILGSGFGASVGEVTLDGRPLDLSEDGGAWEEGRVRAKVPPLAEAREKGFSVPSDPELVVRDHHGRRSEPRTVGLGEVVPVITAVRPRRLILGAERQEIVVAGSGFGEPEGRPSASVVELDGRPATTSENGGWTKERLRVEVPSLKEAKEQGLTLPAELELVVQNRYGRRSAPTSVRLEEAVPVLTGVYPSLAAPGQRVRVVGMNLADADGNNADGRIEILFGKRTGESLEMLAVDEFLVSVPADANASANAAVKFVRVDGAVSNDLPFEILDGSTTATNDDRTTRKH